MQVCFLTKNYMKKANSKNMADNCCKEFSYACMKWVRLHRGPPPAPTMCDAAVDGTVP